MSKLPNSPTSHATLQPTSVSHPQPTLPTDHARVSRTSSSSHHMLSSPSDLTNDQLLTLCTQYGTQAKVWKQKFLGLLPEVDRRKLYKKEGFSSLFEFAAKLGGVSREQVLRVLQLDKRFVDTPQLRKALVSGEVTLHKLSRVASIATSENQTLLLNQSKLLSKAALETLVRDMRTTTAQTVPGHSLIPNKTEKIEQFDELGLSPKIKQRLLALRNKGIDLNQLLEELLDEREENIREEKQKIAEEMKEKGHNKAVRQDNISTAAISATIITTTPSRYIPKKVKDVLHKEFGTKCALERCLNKATNIHHTRRFSLNPSHSPLFLAPLCKQHHEIAHTVDVKVNEKRRR